MKKLTTILTVSFLLLAAAPGLRAQDFENDTLSLKVYFQRNHSEIDRNFRDNGVRVLSAMENLRDDPTGHLMESVLEGFAQYFSEELKQKVVRGMRSNAEKAMVIGPCPFGQYATPQRA